MFFHGRNDHNSGFSPKTQFEKTNMVHRWADFSRFVLPISRLNQKKPKGANSNLSCAGDREVSGGIKRICSQTESSPSISFLPCTVPSFSRLGQVEVGQGFLSDSGLTQQIFQGSVLSSGRLKTSKTAISYPTLQQ